MKKLTLLIITVMTFLVLVNFVNAETDKTLSCFNQEHIFDANTIALWHFNEGLGTTVQDDSGNDNTGTLSNISCVIWTNNCKFGNCLRFTGPQFYGADTYISSIDITKISTLDITNQITLEAWVNRMSNNPDENIGRDYPDGTIISRNGPYALGINANKLFGAIYNSTGTEGGWATANGATYLQVGQWYHLAMTYDGSKIKVFVNGVEDGSIPETGVVTSSSPHVFIGWGEPGMPQYFKGIIDEVRISNIARKFNSTCLNNYPPTIDYYFPNNLNFVMDEGTSQWFIVNASDVDKDSLTYYWYLNGNLVSNTNEFLFSPNYTQAGNYNLTLLVSDGQLNDSMEWNITVNDVCVPNWTLNDTWSQCNIFDSQSKNYYDSNDCNNNTEKPVDLTQSCDYCTPNIGFEGYEDNNICRIDDTFVLTLFDSNNCYSITGLISDKIPESVINFCDYCTPIITSTNSSCQSDNTLIETFTDANNCYNLTLLSTDAVPEPIVHNCTYSAPPSGGGGGGGGSSCSSKWTCIKWANCVEGKQKCLEWNDEKKCSNTRDKPKYETKECINEKKQEISNKGNEGGEDGLSSITGGAVIETKGNVFESIKGFFANIITWIKGLFGG